MLEFNYGRAWHECVKPQFDTLMKSAQISHLYARLKTDALGQDRSTLDCIWPTSTDVDRYIRIDQSNDWTGSLRELFEEVISYSLARAANIIYFYGHLMPGGVPERGVKSGGASWKFANYADQILRERCGVRRADYRPGTKLTIQQGVLAVGHVSNDNIFQATVGFATPELVARTRNALAWSQPLDQYFWGDILDLLIPDDGSPEGNLFRLSAKYTERKVVQCPHCKSCRDVKPDSVSVTDKYNAVYESEAVG